MTHAPDLGSLLAEVRRLTEEVGALALDAFGVEPSEHAPSEHDGETPEARAREASEALLRDRLARLIPGIPIRIAGPGAASGARAAKSLWWCVDPLGGSEELARGTDLFTVDVALVTGARPALGVVHVPARGRTYCGAYDHGAYRCEAAGLPVPIRVRHADPCRPRFVSGRGEATPEVAAMRRRMYMAGVRVASRRVGSALRLCMVAEGSADLAPWSVPAEGIGPAAAQAILEAAGGRLTDLGGRPPSYAASSRAIDLIASGDPDLDWRRFTAPASHDPRPVWTFGVASTACRARGSAHAVGGDAEARF